MLEVLRKYESDINFNDLNYSKSSAVAERPRDASCHWIFC